MAILHKKGGLGVLDNITYIMQHTDKGTKRRTPEEMQAIADERNRQLGLLDVKTKAVVWPEGKPFDKQFLDPTDVVVSLGDRAAQEKFFTTYFPGTSSRIQDWSSQKGVGLAKNLEKISPSSAPDITIPGQWGVVDYPAAKEVIRTGATGGNTATQILAMLLGHETGHGWIDPSATPTHHYRSGLMVQGDAMMAALKQGMSVDDIMKAEENKRLRKDIIERRQYKDPEREAEDRYDINKTKYEEAQRLEGLTEFEKQELYQTQPKTKTTNFIPFTN